MMILQNKYNNFTDFTYKMFQVAELPIYFSKFSNKLYSNFQHLWMLIYKQYRNFTYQELMEDLHSNPDLRQYLSLKNVPHFTTLIKFAQKLPTSVLEKLLEVFTQMVKPAEKIAIDATGFTLDNASPHYCKRIGLPYKKRPFLKVSLVVDIEQYLVLACKTRKSKRHDMVDAKPLLQKGFARSNPTEIYADRAYDSEEIFSFVATQTNAYPFVLQRNIGKNEYKRRGFYRRRFFETFDYVIYTNRAKIETTNSMIKRRFSTNILARNVRMQKFEAFCRIIAYNIDRAMRIGYKVTIKIFWILRVS